MGRDTQVYTMDHVAKMINEDPELLDVITANSDNIDYGEMIYVAINTDEDITALTRRGIESLQSSSSTFGHGQVLCANSSSTKCASPISSRKSSQTNRGSNRAVTEEPPSPRP